MNHIPEIAGAVFDVDETLLDTNIKDPVNGLHEQARLQAAHEAGQRHNIPQLVQLSPEDNYKGFITAPVHTLESATWNILYTLGLATTQEIDPANQLFQEMVSRKDELFEHLLRTHGRPVPGAVEFVSKMAERVSRNFLAIASTAIRRDIDIFLESSGLGAYFTPDHIISKADVTHPKPNPEAFDKGFRVLGLPERARGNVLAFEDNPRGIMSAKAAGLYTCAITTIHSRESLAAQPVAPDLIAGSYAEFEALLGF